MLILYSGGCFAANAPSPYLPSTPGGQPMTPSSASYLPGTPGGQPMTPGTGGMDMMSPVLGNFVLSIYDRQFYYLHFLVFFLFFLLKTSMGETF